jgi:DNA-directed RNA polymerase subunit M/transcription elongation factor TFIIS
MTLLMHAQSMWKRHETGAAERCAKCGARRKPEVRYVDGAADKPAEQLGERLVCVCPECGYMWNERCVDNAA